MTKEEYAALCKKPEWQKKRLEIFQRDEFTCLCCGSKKESLQVHHLKYLPYIKFPWEYPNYLLATYCEICHETEHLIGDQIREGFYEVLDANKIYIRPLAQLQILIEKYPPFQMKLRSFLNETMIEYLRQKEAEIQK